ISYALFIQEQVQSNFTPFIHKSNTNIIKNRDRYPTPFLNTLPRSVIITNSFPAKRRNADYNSAPVMFSDAHLKYQIPLISGQIGFGDFLTLDDQWSESGGPAYVIALHPTYIEQADQCMYVKHCNSVSGSSTQANPAAKFREALDALIAFASNTPSVDKQTLGYQGFVGLQSKPYPNLGVPKKYSMMHHMETISKFL
ncbi:sce7725 family protein, partial [Photobacterium sp. Hal280]|uniref:sce7725 family protein n=1 Tax=Photobacterium sp. Hal280 TaxID=3035163 RepID=UPI00301B76C7